MAGIVGIDRSGNQTQVTQMLQRITHRGKTGSKVIEHADVTMGAVWPGGQVLPTPTTLQQQAVWDGERPPLPEPAALKQETAPFALAAATTDGLFLARDPLGVRPLYYSKTDDGAMCFASEVKALLKVTRNVREFPPGHWYSTHKGIQPFTTVESTPSLSHHTNEIASGLRMRLEQAVCNRIEGQVAGCWLSGGLDSSAMTVLARPHVRELHTFSAGLDGAPDLKFARQVAEFANTKHHEILVTLDEILDALPSVIYHLESFDALLVRSSVTNYLVSKYAADAVDVVFSGEGADELFAGYAYLKDLGSDQLQKELRTITSMLHNTALQRVDRCAGAHGLVPHVPFLDAQVVEYAMRIPPQLKLADTKKATEKWILRQALVGTLPDSVLWRRKVKFWKGAGVGDMLSQHADKQISDQEFNRERTLPNGWELNTKEELMYYRIFREHFASLNDLNWMGRTKGAPTQVRAPRQPGL